MKERYRKELEWWFAELSSEEQVDRYLVLFPELKTLLSKFGIGIFLWNIKGLINIDNSDDTNLVKKILKTLNQTIYFEWFDNTFNECEPEKVSRILRI